METQDVHTLLIDAEEDLHPDHWTRITPALDVSGNPTSILSPTARRLSLLATVHRSARRGNIQHALRPAVVALSNAAKELGYKFVDDAKTFEESRRILRRALWNTVDCIPFKPAQAA